ncbi:serine/threonine-protein kinase [Nocardia sp. NPDC005825]|uniref:serine/threonine-protein kinase n=1 Tax=unclassified Nocardia TaxID=2637762 RepID=UPI0033E9D4D7
MPDESWRAGTMFGRYRLDRMIGRGGMGEVYEAFDTVKGRTVALKVLTERLADDPRFRQRFEREAHVAARLKEAHVIPIHDYGEIDGKLFLDMRLVEGMSLRELIADNGFLPPARAVAIVAQVASALDAAHRDSLVHRDVKPDNILVADDDFVYLVDFGIANTMTSERMTTIGAAIGSFSYMAPERFADSRTTPAADTYALACVLHECLTGLKPFQAKTAPQLMHAHLYAPPPAPSMIRPGVPQALDQVVARGMAKDPADRFPTAGMLAVAAKAAVAPEHTPVVTTIGSMPMPYFGVPQPGPMDAAPPRQTAPPPRSRRKPLLIGIVVLVAALIAGLVTWQVLRRSGGSELDLAALDVGHYSTTPRKFTGSPTVEEGRALAASAIAEGMPDPFQIDTSLDHRYGTAQTSPAGAATMIAGTSTPLTQPVMEKYGMISAYGVVGLTKRFTDWSSKPEGNMLLILTMSYPNPDAAARAATEMEAVDFAASPDNVRIPIPGFAQAHAHYRPTSPTIGATWSYRTFVTSIIAALDMTRLDADALAQRVGQVFTAQSPLLDNVRMVVDASLTMQTRDPDQMLHRAFVTNDQQLISPTYGSIGPRAASLCENAQPHRDRLSEKAGIDRCATTNESNVLRARDEDAARTFLTGTVKSDRAEYIKRDIDAPPKLGAARCFEAKDSIWAADANVRFQCGVTFGRHIAFVWSNDEQDVRRRAAAQYVILANS